MITANLQIVINAAIETLSAEMGITEEAFKAMLQEQGPESVAARNFSRIVAGSYDLIASK